MNSPGQSPTSSSRLLPFQSWKDFSDASLGDEVAQPTDLAPPYHPGWGGGVHPYISHIRFVGPKGIALVWSENKYRIQKWILRILFYCCPILSNDDIISQQPGLKTGIKTVRSENRCERMTFFGLKWDHDLENRAAYPHQEFPRLPPRHLSQCYAISSLVMTPH